MIDYLKLLRMRQWLKNLMLFFPPFLSGALLQPGLWRKGVFPFAAFSCAASATYVVNDLFDAAQDRCHQQKRHRPIASRRVSVAGAVMLSLLLASAAISLASLASGSFTLFVIIYLLVTVAYSLGLKNVLIVDVFCIAAGFIIRLEAGASAFGIQVSEWLFLSVFLLAIFLSIGKRRCEKSELGELAGSHRKNLEFYPDGFLDMAMAMCGASALVTYTMYTLKHGILVYSVPLCMFGLLRYMLRVKSGQGGDPTDSLIKDGPLLLTGLSWVIFVTISVYR